MRGITSRSPETNGKREREREFQHRQNYLKFSWPWTLTIGCEGKRKNEKKHICECKQKPLSESSEYCVVQKHQGLGANTPLKIHKSEKLSDFCISLSSFLFMGLINIHAWVSGTHSFSTAVWERQMELFLICKQSSTVRTVKEQKLLVQSSKQNMKNTKTKWFLITFQISAFFLTIYSPFLWNSC